MPFKRQRPVKNSEQDLMFKPPEGMSSMDDYQTPMYNELTREGFGDFVTDVCIAGFYACFPL